MRLIYAVFALVAAGQANAGIPVVGGPVDVRLHIEQVLAANPELAHMYPGLAAELAEVARQREADAYNRQRAQDLKRAQATPSAHRVPAGKDFAETRSSAR